MIYTADYDSPIGNILMAAEDGALCGLWFYGGKYCPALLGTAGEDKALSDARRWLDIYFTGREPDFMPLLRLSGSPFQTAVWELLRQIPYGETVTYGGLAARLAEKRGLKRISAQAVGGAVGHNPVSIIVPCHRVVGANGSLTGYAGGVEKKRRLLAMEGINTGKFTLPLRGTAL